MWMLSLWSRYIYSLHLSCLHAIYFSHQLTVTADNTFSQEGNSFCAGSSVKSHGVLFNRLCLLWCLIFPSKRTWRRTRPCSPAWLCSTHTVLLWYSTNTIYTWYYSPCVEGICVDILSPGIQASYNISSNMC